MSYSSDASTFGGNFRLSSAVRRISDSTARSRARMANDELPASKKKVDDQAAVATPAGESGGRDKAARWPLPGLAPMTRVRTNFGDVHAIALRKGDMVETRDGLRPIVWLNRVLLDAEFLGQKPDSNPVLMQAGAVGRNAPSADMMMSPRQIVCTADGPNAGQPCEAASMVGKPGVRRRRETGLSYTMFHVGEPSDVMCEGVFLHFAPPS